MTKIMDIVVKVNILVDGGLVLPRTVFDLSRAVPTKFNFPLTYFASLVLRLTKSRWQKCHIVSIPHVP